MSAAILVNQSEYAGGGIALMGLYTLNMAGTLTVSDNTDRNGASNLMLGGHPIHVTGSVSDASSVGVKYNTKKLGVITEGLKGKAALSS